MLVSLVYHLLLKDSGFNIIRCEFVSVKKTSECVESNFSSIPIAKEGKNMQGCFANASFGFSAFIIKCF